MILFNKLTIINIALSVTQIVSGLLLCIYISREYEKGAELYSIIIMYLINVLIGLNLHSSLIIVNLLASVSLYLISLMDSLALYRKKNYIIAVLIGIILGIIVKINILYMVYIPFVFLVILRKKGDKRTLKLTIGTILSFILGYIVYSSLDKMSFHQVNISAFNSAMMYFLSYYFMIINLIGSYYMARSDKPQSGKIFRLLTIIIAIIGLITKNLEVMIGYYPIYLLLAITINNSTPYKKLIVAHKAMLNKKVKATREVCAVIPNYNYEKYICDRIDSVLYQTYPVSEIIILDDVSKDNSVEVINEKIKEVKELYPNIKISFQQNKVNSGNVFKQWAKAFKLCSKDFLWICEADDSASPHFLENVMRAFENEEVILSYAESLTMDENSELLMSNLREWIDIEKTGKWNKSYIKAGKEEIEDTLCINNTIANVSSVVFRKLDSIDYNGYLKMAEEFKLAGDWYFYCKVLENGSIAYNSKSLNYHRMHSKSVTLTTKDDFHLKEITRIQDMIIKSHNLSEERKKQF